MYKIQWDTSLISQFDLDTMQIQQLCKVKIWYILQISHYLLKFLLFGRLNFYLSQKLLAFSQKAVSLRDVTNNLFPSKKGFQQTCTQRWIFIKILRNYTDGVLKNLVIFELEIRFLIWVKYIVSMVLLDTNEWKNQNDILINLKLLSDW